MKLSKFYSLKKYILFFYLIFNSDIHLKAQLTVNSINVNEWVKTNFGGQGIIVGSITHKGNKNAIGGFKSTKNVLKISNGLLISTGFAQDAIGPNNSYNISKDFSYAVEQDKDLKLLEKGDLYDLSYIEFDFVSFENSITFNYQFASDEYPEYVGSSFNDIFAFFVIDDKTSKNIAVIPSKTLPVSVNNINNQNNPNLYINNNVFSNDISSVSFKNKFSNKKINIGKLWYNLKTALKKNNTHDGEYLLDGNLLKSVNEDLYNFLQYDGITQKLSAHAYVEPYKKYRLKIIIADVADNFYDSAVFLESKSFIASKDTMQIKFKNYYNYSEIIDPKLILKGEKLFDILPPKFPIPSTDIYFDFNKAIVKNEEILKINQLVSIYNKIKDYYQIEITGNTDNVGSYNFNYILSKKRCDAVIKILKNKIQDFGTDGSEYNSFSRPISNNKTELGRKLNRRVSIQFVKIKKNG